MDSITEEYFMYIAILCTNTADHDGFLFVGLISLLNKKSGLR